MVLLVMVKRMSHLIAAIRLASLIVLSLIWRACFLPNRRIKKTNDSTYSEPFSSKERSLFSLSKSSMTMPGISRFAASRELLDPEIGMILLYAPLIDFLKIFAAAPPAL